jgi:hypothetical protein
MNGPAIPPGGTSGGNVSATPGQTPTGVPRAGRLGLGLGLNPMQRGGLLQAAQGGGAQDWLSAHPEIAERVQNRMNASTAAGTPQAGNI